MKVLDKIKFILDKFQEIVSTITLGVMTVIVVWQVVAVTYSIIPAQSPVPFPSICLFG